MAMVTGIWGAEVVDIITVGAGAAGIIMHGRVADIADGIEGGNPEAGTACFEPWWANLNWSVGGV